MRTIKQTYEINAPREAVWAALTDPNQIERWGGGPAKMDENVGTEFSLWDGEIWGVNKKVVKNKLLVQEWWSETDKWENPSLAKFELSDDKEGTKLTLTQSGVPERNAKDIDDGWKDFYLGPLKDYLESKN